MLKPSGRSLKAAHERFYPISNSKPILQKDRKLALTARGAMLDEKDDPGYTALMIAAELGHTVAVEKLIAAGAGKTLTAKSGKTAADFASDDAIEGGGK